VEDLAKASRLKEKEVPIAIGWLRRKGWATVERGPQGTRVTLTDKGRRAVGKRGPDEELLRLLAEGELPADRLDPKVVKDLLSRQDVIREREAVVREVILTEDGRAVLDRGIELKEEVAQLTSELLQSGRWRDVSFRRYDVDAYAPTAVGGKRHPLSRYVQRIRQIFLSMGFTEFQGSFVEVAFWNMDALFTPQDHPARDLQDTFYLSRPAKLPLPPDDVVSRVKAMHESGGDIDSDGWGYEWSREEAEKALLRTHTTANTIRWLEEHPEPPVKVFTIDRIFRRESLDATHLDEFQQIEGIVMEEGASLGMLFGLLQEFYSRMGFEKIRMRPAYFPYTEPSMEVEVYHNGEWLELGGTGIFRPEVTRPFGVEHPVLAWGLGLERLIMVVEGVEDIRDVYMSDIDWLRNHPVGRSAGAAEP
jgi:phenylalanyl-tRNA synthetase alpha chain